MSKTQLLTTSLLICGAIAAFSTQANAGCVLYKCSDNYMGTWKATSASDGNTTCHDFCKKGKHGACKTSGFSNQSCTNWQQFDM